MPPDRAGRRTAGQRPAMNPQTLVRRLRAQPDQVRVIRQEVKDFGAMMVADHTTSSNKLKAAVGEGGAGLTVPTDMLPKHRQQLDALRGAGTNFDSLYTQQQVAAHEEALALLQRQADSGTAPLKAFAAATVPVVEGHLEHVRELSGAAGGGE